MQGAVAGRRGLEQWGGLGGVLYVALFIVGIILAESGQPDTSGDQAKVRAYWASSGHRDRVSLGWALIVLGIFFLLWFLASLRLTLRRLDADGFLTTLAMLGGAVYAVLSLAAIAVNTALKTMSDDTYRHTVYPELIHAADDTWYVLHSSGGIGAGAMMIAASAAASRAGLVPAWAGWIGVIAGVLALGSIFFLPQFLIALWLVVAGVLLFVQRPAPAVRPV